MAKVCLLFLLLAGLCLPGYAQKKTISILGSSTAAGFGLPDANGDRVYDTDDNLSDDLPVNSWANRLRRYYDNLGLLNGLYNFAIYGKDTYWGLSASFYAANPDYVGLRGPYDPNNNPASIDNALNVNSDIVIINFPSNNYDFFTLTETMSVTRELYKESTANGHTIAYITTTQPRTSDNWNPANSSDWLENRKRLKEIRDSIVAEYPNNYIDFWTPLVDNVPETDPNYLGIKPEYAQTNEFDNNQLDGTHVNEAGHLLLYNAVLAKNIVPIAPLPLKVGSLHVKRVDDTHITVTFTILDGNTEKEFFIWVKDKAGNTKSVKVIIPDASKSSQTITETIQIY
ncbi:MAG TPA: SGNH/GDSL hydrolase family protein [Puia sp.]